MVVSLAKRDLLSFLPRTFAFFKTSSRETVMILFSLAFHPPYILPLDYRHIWPDIVALCHTTSDCVMLPYIVYIDICEENIA